MAKELGLRRPGRFLIIAHRGYSSHYPENSIEAFEAAIEAGADLIETDAREGAEGSIVLSHDEVGRTAHQEFKGEAPVSLPSLLKLARKRISLLLDLKQQDQQFLQRVLDAVEQMDMLDQIIFGVRDIESARNLSLANEKAVILGFLPRDHYDFENFYEVGGHIARIWEKDLQSDKIMRARGGGARPIWVAPRGNDGLVGNIDEARQRMLMGEGIDGVLVNDPTAAINVRRAFLESGGS